MATNFVSAIRHWTTTKRDSLMQPIARDVVLLPYYYILWPAAIAFILASPLFHYLYYEFSAHPAINHHHVYPLSVSNTSYSSETAHIPTFHDIASSYYPKSSNFASSSGLPPLYTVHQAVVMAPLNTNPLASAALRTALEPLLHLESHPTGLPHLYSPYITNMLSTEADSVLLTPRSTKGSVTSAQGLIISYITNNSEQDQTWDAALQKVSLHSSTPNQPVSSIITTSAWSSSNVSISSIANTTLSELPKSAVLTDQRPYSLFRNISIFPQMSWGLQALLVAYGLISFLLSCALVDFSPIRSKIGIFMAYFVEVTLCMSAAASCTSFLFPEFDLFFLCQVFALPILVVLTAAQNSLNLINEVSRCPREASPLSTVSKSYCKAAPSSLAATLSTVLALLFLAYTMQIGPEYKFACIYTCIALICCFCMHHTYFAAVLSVDLRRLELDELIGMPNSFDSLYSSRQCFSSQLLPKFLRTAYNKLVSRGIPLKTFFYVTYIRPHQSSIIISVFIVIYLRFSQCNTEDTGNLLRFTRTAFYSASLAANQYPGLYQVMQPLCLTLDPTSNKFMQTPFYNTPAFMFRGYIFFSVVELALMLVVILSLAGVILNSVLPEVPLGNSSDPNTDPFVSDRELLFAKDLTGIHSLDVFQLAVSDTWIATLSLDHQVCVWVPDKSGSPTSAKNFSCFMAIAVPPPMWPVSKMVLSKPSKRLALVSFKLACISLWDLNTGTVRLWIKNMSLFSAQTFVSAFVQSNGSILAFGKRQFYVLEELIDSNGATTASQAKTVQWPVQLFKDEDMIDVKLMQTFNLVEKVVVLTSHSRLLVISSRGGEWICQPLRLMESFSAITSENNIMGSVIHNQQGELMKNITRPSVLGSPTNRHLDTGIMTSPYEFESQILAIELVKDLHMILVASDVTASLIDANTGVILRHFHIGQFKQGTLRVFHAQPTHCRFCGCASVQSISIAYTNRDETDMVICHTLSIEHRARNNICLRVERDPRETRCLGFEATTEHQHWITSVEAWDATDLNRIIGIRRKESSTLDVASMSSQEQWALAFPTPGTISPSQTPQNNTSTGVKTPPSHAEFDLATMVSSRSLSPSSWASKGASVFSRKRSRSQVNRTSDRKSHTNDTASPSAAENSIPPLSMVWEGWTMSDKGVVSYYKIPDTANSSRLLIPRVGPIAKYGHKSLCVVFGNIAKLLYFGKEETHDNVQSTSPIGSRSRRKVAY